MKMFIQNDEGHKIVCELTKNAADPTTTLQQNTFNLLVLYSELEDNYIGPERIKSMFEALIGTPIVISNQIVKLDVPIAIKETIKW